MIFSLSHHEFTRTAWQTRNRALASRVAGSSFSAQGGDPAAMHRRLGRQGAQGRAVKRPEGLGRWQEQRPLMG